MDWGHIFRVLAAAPMASWETICVGIGRILSRNVIVVKPEIACTQKYPTKIVVIS